MSFVAHKVIFLSIYNFSFYLKNIVNKEKYIIILERKVTCIIIAQMDGYIQDNMNFYTISLNLWAEKKKRYKSIYAKI